jgi:DNA-binding NtrC family response regulator
MLTRAGFRTYLADSVTTGIDALREHSDELDIVLTDLRLGEESGMGIVAAARADAPEAVVIAMTALATVPTAVAAMRAGAYDFLVKPFEPEEALVRAVERGVERKRLLERNRFLETKVQQSARFPGLIGDSAPMRRLFTLVESVSPADTTVLILGESGTGKELIARAIHDRSRRAGKAFLPVNCGAFAESLLESELFGHARGAFTGATGARKGLFEEASSGTIFLDEIGEMPLPLQVRLLRVLEAREVRPVGSNETRKVDVRVIAATNRDLAAATRAGTFREDLYYRLNVVCIDAPPLRARSNDIPLLVHHFVERYAKELGKVVDRIEPEALHLLCAHPWPGNVRELQNAIERSVVLSKEGAITVDLLPPSVALDGALEGGLRRPYTLPLGPALEAFERSYIVDSMRKAKGNIAEAARAAGVDRSNFRRLLKRHGIDAGVFGEGGGQAGGD